MKFEMVFTNSKCFRYYLETAFNVPEEEIDSFVVELHSGEYWIENGMIMAYCDHMPYDRLSSDGHNLCHATGREYWDSEHQCWCFEYEDEADADQTDAEFLRDFDIYMMDNNEDEEYDDEPPFNPCLDDDDED